MHGEPMIVAILKFNIYKYLWTCVYFKDVSTEWVT